MPKIKVNNPKNIIKGTPTRYYFKLHNTSGPKGDKGDTGATGAQGPKGDTGNAATIHVGSTTTLSVGQDATVENVGSQYAAVLNFGIPQGPQGPKGDKGDTGATGATGPQGATGAKGDPGQNATVYIGTTTTGAPGTQASVYNSGTENNAVLNFTIPQGAQGDLGPANTLSIGSVTKGADAGATITGDAPNQTLNLVLPKGDTGPTGPTGPQGPQGVPGVQGVPGKDFSIYKTYASVADMNADAANVPEGEFVMIASTTEDPDNAKLYVKNGEGTFTYLSDLSGAQGIQGPRGEQGVPGPQGIPGPTGPTGPRGSVKSQYVAELPASGDEDTFYITDKDLESHAESGEYITLETTQTAAAIQSAQLNGNATQTTYSGKNLIQPSSMYASSFNVTVNNTDSSVEVNGTGYATYTIPTQFEPTDKVTFSCKGVQKTGTGLRVAYRHSDDGTTWTQYVTVAEVNNTTAGQQYSLVGTFTGYAYYQIVFYARGYSSTTTSNDAVYSEIQLERGSSATDFEPYVGGIPAPNPQFPQPISVVTGENVVKVVGKNLLEIPNSTYSDSGVDWSVQDGVITLNGTTTRVVYAHVSPVIPSMGTETTNYPAYVIMTEANSFELPAGNYAVSAKVANNGNMTWSGLAFGIGQVGARPTRVVHLRTSAGVTDTVSGTFTIADGERVMPVAFYEGTTTNVTVDTTISDIQLELGSTATSYEAYTAQDYTIDLGSIELAKIGTYQDRIYKEGEKWYVEKQIGKVVLDGSESWYEVTSDGGYFQLNTPLMNVIPFSGNPANNALCDHFTPRSRWYVGSGRANLTVNLNGSYTAIRYETYPPTAQGLADFKTWLSTHPTTVYYALATPTTTEITNQTLIDQLEALASATLNQGVNHIFTEIATGNAMPTLELNWAEWEKYNRHNVYIWNDDIDDWQVIVQ